LCCIAGFGFNFPDALELYIHATLLNSRCRVFDADEASWFYIPYYGSCRYLAGIFGWEDAVDVHLLSDTVSEWLATDPSVSHAMASGRPHFMTLAVGNDFEAVGPEVFDKVHLMGHLVRDCGLKQGHRSCFSGPCTSGEIWRYGQWCPRTSAGWDVAIPHFAEPSIAAIPSESSLLWMRSRPIDILFQGGPTHAFRAYVVEVFRLWPWCSSSKVSERWKSVSFHNHRRFWIASICTPK